MVSFFDVTNRLILIFFFRWFPLVLLLIFVVFLPLGWGSVTYILVSEIVPTSVRTEVAVLCNSWEQLLQFGVLQLHSVVCGKYGPQYLHWGFALTSAMGAIFVWIFVPETSGKTLEEIETFFTHLRSVHVFAEKFQPNQIYSLKAHLFSNNQKRIRGARKMNLFTILVEL